MLKYCGMPSITTNSAAETRRLGASLGRTLRGGEVLELTGPLGSGKTTFVKGLAQGLGVKAIVRSPTFLLARAYPLPRGQTLYHLDLYRLKNSDELLALGLSEILNQRNIVVVEWPELLKTSLPQGTLKIQFRLAPGRPKERHITLDNYA